MDNIENILSEANRCLNCKKPLCVSSCPINTRIPDFIYEIKNNNLKKAYEILFENNIMSDICSNVCPYIEYCTGNCVRGIKGLPVQISKLEKFVNSWAKENNIEYSYKTEKKNGIKIAIIGSGPAGIECAKELAINGFDVTIYEKESDIGGLLTYGIPGFRLPRDITIKLTDRIKKLGIKIITKTELGKDISIEFLKKKYTAIFIGIGAGIPSEYYLTDKSCKTIYKSDYILREYNAKRVINNLGDVIIIGGGNVAIDSARAVLRMGAKSSTIVYRRNKEKMPAIEEEVKLGIKEGVKIVYNTNVLGAELEKDSLKQIKCIKTEIIEDNVVNIDNSEFYINADSIVFAIGLKPDRELILKEKININKNGLIIVDEKYMTNIDGVFAGGDVIQNKSTVCMAINNGRNASKYIVEYCKNKK